MNGNYCQNDTICFDMGWVTNRKKIGTYLILTPDLLNTWNDQGKVKNTCDILLFKRWKGYAGYVSLLFFILYVFVFQFISIRCDNMASIRAVEYTLM